MQTIDLHVFNQASTSRASTPSFPSYSTFVV